MPSEIVLSEKFQSLQNEDKHYYECYVQKALLEQIVFFGYARGSGVWQAAVGVYFVTSGQVVEAADFYDFHVGLGDGVGVGERVLFQHFSECCGVDFDFRVSED